MLYRRGQRSRASKVDDPNLTHYQASQRAGSSRMIILTLINVEKDMLALGEQFFVPFLSAHAGWVYEVEPKLLVDVIG